MPYAAYLEPLDGAPEREVDYTEVHLADTDLTDVDAGNARFTECAVTGVSFDGGSFARARFNDVWVSRTRWIGCSWAEAQLLEVSFLDGVLAGVQAYGARMRRVVVERCKVDSLNLRGADLRDVEFRDCELLEADFGGATLANVSFPGSTLRRARFGKAALTKVDFRGARELDVAEGGDALRGAIIDSGQLAELAPMLAQTLGIVVKDR
ncbi:pentapeptide repeat-containing protein [Phytohabitans houttuyneae]